VAISPNSGPSERQGRRKKIQSISCNKHGLLVAGCEKGEVQVYKLRAEDIAKKSPNCFSFVDSYALHRKEVHHVSFTPDPSGKYVLTGSRDGSVQVFELSQEQRAQRASSPEGKRATSTSKRVRENSRQISDDPVSSPQQTSSGGFTVFDPEKLKVKLDQRSHLTGANTDMVIWSARGKYVFASISGKKQGENEVEHGFIKVWNSLTGQTIENLASGVELWFQNLVLAPHPTDEDILVTASGKGKIYLWDVA
jgi:WD40 repeat protein